MRRTIEITVAPVVTDHLCRELEQLEDVIGLSVQRGIAVKPPGDVLIVHVLNRGADKVLQAAHSVQKYGAVSIVTAEVSSIIDPEHAVAVDNDVDEAIWEEMETSLRHQGRVSANYIILMALGGAIAAAGLVSEPVPQAIAFVAASIIAPGFEPIAKIPLGIVLRRWEVVWRGVVAVGVGYLVLIAAGALTFLLLHLTGSLTVEAFVSNHEVERLAHPTVLEIFVSTCAAIAGITMITAYRRNVIAGPLIALILISAAAMIGAALVVGQPLLAVQALQRLGIDTALIVFCGIVVVLLKQVFVHRRASMV